MSFGWLHLSDLHEGQAGQRWLWPQFEELFLDDLERLHDKSGPWDAIFLTGDISYSGQADQFQAAQEKLDKVFRMARRKGSKPVLLSVPGNHDLVRPPDSPPLRALARWRSDRQLQTTFWDDHTCENRRLVDAAFSGYLGWWHDSSIPRPHELAYGILPGDFSTVIRKKRATVGIVGLNTAFLQLAKGQFKGKLALSPQQFHLACQGNGAKWAAACDVCLLLTHHPPDWLDPESQRVLNGEIAPPARFAIHLFGHMHEHALRKLSIGGSDFKRTWQSASLFGLEYWGEKRPQKRAHGYSAGRIDFGTGSKPGSVRIWPRVAHQDRTGRWKIIPDTLEVDLTTDESTQADEIVRRGSPVPTISARRRPAVGSSTTIRDTSKLRVLLVSTDRDLKEAREQTSQYLSISAEVEVTHFDPAVPTDPATFDCVVVLQAWCWENGFVAQAWREAERATRLAFLADEKSSWPPRILTDIDAIAHIRRFRTHLKDAVVFQDPNQLAEKVGKAIHRRLEAGVASAGVAARNLRDWERAYLEYRLTAWKAGRTTTGRSHLLDPEHATELYRAELYVPLDGISDRWQCGPDGWPTELGNRRDSPLVTHEAERRVHLACWVSVPEIPRLVFVAAPGGGKTVFLTRIAAHLGSLALGRPVELEAVDLKKPNSRGLLRVPIVVEATRLADYDCRGLPTLCQAVQAEVAQALGEGSVVPSSEIEQGLRDGRYLLLVDALDEVADPDKRQAVLGLLKSAGGAVAQLRIVVTTRSARYTGALAFGPEFEVVNVAPFSNGQVDDFCTKWTTHRRQSYLSDLQSAVRGLGAEGGEAVEDLPLASNPLMLTAICMVYERHRSLPDDRAELCSLLVDDLCRSRTSKDPSRDWFFGDGEKRDLLERIALAMQEAGQQAWPVSRAEEVALQGILQTESDRAERATRHVQWIAEHTGLLRFEQPDSRPEEVRFWHRLFREYLAATCLARQDATVDTMVRSLSANGRLVDPFWEDVIRLLPRCLGTRERAGQLVKTLSACLEDVGRHHRGRLFGLVAAAIVESRTLFPLVDVSTLGRHMAVVYENEGATWSIADRLLLLRGLGRLDASVGDPRLREERWVNVVASSDAAGGVGIAGGAGFEMAWAPVTVQEYGGFVDSAERDREEWWAGIPDGAVTVAERVPREWRAQLRSPNAPVAWVSHDEAEAYCRWRTSLASDGRIVVLPSLREWELAATDPATGQLDFGPDLVVGVVVEPGRWPVGTRRPNCHGLVDLGGLVWQWTRDQHGVEKSRLPRARSEGRSTSRMYSVCGGPDPHGRGKSPHRHRALAEHSVRAPVVGFRCVVQRQS